MLGEASGEMLRLQRYFISYIISFSPPGAQQASRQPHKQTLHDIDVGEE